jgi:hypothetical protein
MEVVKVLQSLSWYHINSGKRWPKEKIIIIINREMDVDLLVKLILG